MNVKSKKNILIFVQANRICTEGMDLMTSPVPDTTEDCPDVGTSVLSQIDSFLDKIQPMLDELQSLKTNLKSPSSSQSKTLVKQVWDFMYIPILHTNCSLQSKL